ncbi:MAG: polysaccharide biosynthesis protein, partial [Oscillospiraceae bacterium]|nr:polysaccharide biosynthesis protein [Oscillospiraceae bacterium]
MESMSHARRTMVIGAGVAGRMLLTEILNAQQSPYEDDKYAAQFNPVCIIDNDPEKIGTEVMGVKVVGPSSDIPQYARKYRVEQIILAIPSLEEERRKLIIDLCNETKLPLKIIPFIGTLILEDNVTLLGQVRDIKTEELLGRDPVRFNNKNIRTF